MQRHGSELVVFIEDLSSYKLESCTLFPVKNACLSSCFVAGHLGPLAIACSWAVGTVSEGVRVCSGLPGMNMD